MGLDLNGSTITLSGSNFLVKDSGANTILTFDTSGRALVGASIPAFRVHNSTAGWASLSADTWNLTSWNSLTFNQGSHFASNAFTAPVTGTYLFAAGTYNYFTTTGHYIYPSFSVNGGLAVRKPGAQVSYRVRGHSLTAGYSFDCQISDIYYLTAGDYVNFYQYSGGNSNSWYPTYSHFSGCQIG